MKKLLLALTLLLLTSSAYAYTGRDYEPKSPEEIRREQIALHKTQHKIAQTQRTWKAVYNSIQEKVAPKALIMPEKFKRFFPLEFVEWLADELSYRNTGDLIEFANCWHGWGVEIQKRYGWTRVCLKYEKMENAYRPADREMMLEYMDAIEERF